LAASVDGKVPNLDGKVPNLDGKVPLTKTSLDGKVPLLGLKIISFNKIFNDDGKIPFLLGSKGLFVVIK